MLVPDLKPLFQIYDVYQQLDMVKGHMTNRVNEGTAFLEFLKERVSYTTNKRAEIIQQIMNITQLLQDMSCLLLEYEKALTLLRQ